MNFEVAKPKLNINIQNSLGLINLIWAQPPHSIFVCLQLFFPFLLLCGLQRGMILRLVRGRDCIFPVLWSEKRGHQETAVDKELVCHKLISLDVLGRRELCEADVCQLRAWLREASCPRTMCGWKGKPILLLLAVRFKLHAGGFDDNMVLPPGASSESWAWKQHQGNHLLLSFWFFWTHWALSPLRRLFCHPRQADNVPQDYAILNV